MSYPTLSVQDAFIRASGLMTSTNIMPAAWEVHGEFTVEEILRAVGRVVARHDCLRTSILADESSYRQRVTNDVDIERHIDVVDLSDADAELAMSWLMGQHLADPFELTNSPLWRGLDRKSVV